MEMAKINAYIMHIFGKIELLSKRQRHTYILHTGNMVEI